MDEYHNLDDPRITEFLFHPKKNLNVYTKSDDVIDLLIPVDDEIVVGGRFFIADKKSPTILFFHGNGEVVPDYNDLGEIIIHKGINFFPVDYRGYGRSTGSPSVSSMMKDADTIYRYTRAMLDENGFTGTFIVMGRSLGSASAIELASRYNDEIDGIIIESGFAYTIPLLKLLGIDVEDLGIMDDSAINNMEKIVKISKPALVIHAEKDHIIPFGDGVALYSTLKSVSKKFLKIPKANHNNIFQHGFKQYMEELTGLIKGLPGKN